MDNKKLLYTLSMNFCQRGDLHHDVVKNLIFDVVSLVDTMEDLKGGLIDTCNTIIDYGVSLEDSQYKRTWKEFGEDISSMIWWDCEEEHKTIKELLPEWNIVDPFALEKANKKLLVNYAIVKVCEELKKFLEELEDEDV